MNHITVVKKDNSNFFGFLIILAVLAIVAYVAIKVTILAMSLFGTMALIFFLAFNFWAVAHGNKPRNPVDAQKSMLQMVYNDVVKAKQKKANKDSAEPLIDETISESDKGKALKFCTMAIFLTFMSVLFLCFVQLLMVFSFAKDPIYQVYPLNILGFLTTIILIIDLVFDLKKIFTFDQFINQPIGRRSKTFWFSKFVHILVFIYILSIVAVKFGVF